MVQNGGLVSTEACVFNKGELESIKAMRDVLRVKSNDQHGSVPTTNVLKTLGIYSIESTLRQRRLK